MTIHFNHPTQGPRVLEFPLGTTAAALERPVSLGLEAPVLEGDEHTKTLIRLSAICVGGRDVQSDHLQCLRRSPVDGGAPEWERLLKSEGGSS